MDHKAIMDPAASPARPGVRRVNNVPVAILGAAVAVFLVIMACVAAGRAADAGGKQEEAPVRSALGVAETVAGRHEAGEVPAGSHPGSADLDPPRSASSGGAGARPAQSGTSPDKGDFPAPPPPPPPPGALDGANGGAMPSGSTPGEQPGAPRYLSAEAGHDDQRDLERMKFEMFKQAIAAKTAALRDAEASSSNRAERPSEVRSELAAAQAAAAGGSYVDKLRRLQEVGLLPEPAGATSQRGQQGDAYSQFAGDRHQDRWALGAEQQAPGSPYELRAGAVIPATLQTGINSDLPGQITAVVAQDVRDTARGRYVLIPQGSRLVGTYGADVRFGQERVLVAWQRIVWPDGKALDIGAMPGADAAGYAGFKDQVDNHFWRLFGSALLLSGITGGIAYTQDSQAREGNQITVGGTMSQALGQQLGQVSEEMIRRQMNVAPTIEIRPGYRFNVQVTKDLTFNAPYVAFDYERSISAAGRIFRMQSE